MAPSLAHSSQGGPPAAEPWTETPNTLHNALIQISDLRAENQVLHEYMHALFVSLKQTYAARGLPPPRLDDP